METVLCDKCIESIDINDIAEGEYYETDAEDTIEEIECPHCWTLNEIYWQPDVYFWARKKR